MNRMRVLRVMRDLTQEGLAKKVGISQSSICLIENKRAFPEDDLKKKIARALGESKEKIFGD